PNQSLTWSNKHFDRGFSEKLNSLYIPIEKYTTFQLKSIPPKRILNRLFAIQANRQNHAKSGNKSSDCINVFQRRQKPSGDCEKATY
ncbi:MAG: hypothetical protein ACREHG_01730, partial [Candidatus Saccharimonadales bacterium]